MPLHIKYCRTPRINSIQVYMGVPPPAFCPPTTSPAKNADGPGHPLYLLQSKKTTKGCRCYPSRKRPLRISCTIYLCLCRLWEFRTVASVHSPSCPSKERTAGEKHFGKRSWTQLQRFRSPFRLPFCPLEIWKRSNTTLTRYRNSRSPSLK